MNAVKIMLFYSLCSSSVLVYGIGVRQAFLNSGGSVRILSVGVKVTVTTVLSVCLLYPVSTFLMIPHGMADMLPFFCICAVVCVSKITDSLAGFIKNFPAGEIIFSLGSVLLAMTEGVSFAENLLVAFSCCVSFLGLSFFLYAVRKRLEYTSAFSDFRGSPLILISMGLLVLVLYAWNISWWNYGRIG